MQVCQDGKAVSFTEALLSLSGFFLKETSWRVLRYGSSGVLETQTLSLGLCLWPSLGTARVLINFCLSPLITRDSLLSDGLSS